MSQQALLRNFSIIAHIDHGKTTLTDRLLEMTGTVEPRLMHQRYLDSHPIAQERGVTIKLAPVRMNYKLGATF
jgi:GTP-binding protein LepA